MHGCKYCYAPNILRQRRDDWGESVQVKKNIPVVLGKELKKLKPALVGISSVTDPYQDIEDKYKLTRYCLEQLLKFKFPVSMITKSPLILRDIDLLSKFDYSEITITITTLDQSISNILEPNAPTISKRLDALTKLSDSGFNTYAFIGPLYPTLEPEQVQGFIERIAETGVQTIMVDTLNLKPGIWPNVEKALSLEPELKEIFHSRLFKDRKYYTKIINQIENTCSKIGINFE
jgi:DNA repair photolyase